MLMNIGQQPVALEKPVADHGGLAGQGADGGRVEGSVSIAGAVVQWLRDGLG